MIKKHFAYGIAVVLIFSGMISYLLIHSKKSETIKPVERPLTKAEKRFNELNSIRSRSYTLTEAQQKDQAIALGEKYGDELISAKGIVKEVIPAIWGRGVYVSLEKGEEFNKVTIRIEVPEDNPYLDVARNLNKGQTILFKGKFSSFNGTYIFVKGDVEFHLSEEEEK